MSTVFFLTQYNPNNLPKSLTEKFNLTETGTRAAFVSYTIGDGDSITEFGFQTNIEDFKTKVDEIEYAAGFTLTGAAIEHAYIDIIRKESRPDAAVSIIVITDGFSFDDVKTPSDLLRAVYIEMFAIGVKNYNIEQLEDIANEPHADYLYTIPDFDSFPEIVIFVTFS